MSQVFADTSFYVAFVNPRDAMHSAAVNFVRRFRGNSVTTECVLVEVGNWLARSGDRDVFSDLLTSLRADPGTTIIEADHALFEAGLALYSRRRDKTWSVTDCMSFAVMHQRRLAEALTTDRHFTQAGFKTLLA
ncbi:MAG: type II toxin-antitoxin system VapC family toxin [Planctomycetes bacterium]|nr:type II toxin-antitoxin system VapC family toxin [Planctomycetota bacterium]